MTFFLLIYVSIICIAIKEGDKILLITNIYPLIENRRKKQVETDFTEEKTTKIIN